MYSPIVALSHMSKCYKLYYACLGSTHDATTALPQPLLENPTKTAS